VKVPRHNPPSASDAEPAPAEATLHMSLEELRALESVFRAPSWLRDLGLASWFLVGVIVLLVGLTALLAATSEIVMPMLAAIIVSVVTSPIVGWLARHRVPRGAGAAIVLLGLVAACVAIALLVVGGIVSQSGAIGSYATDAAGKAQGWLGSLGIDDSARQSAKDNVSAAAPATISTLVNGIVTGIRGIASLAFGLSFAAIGIFFLLKDGPRMRRWIDGHLGVPLPVAETITGGVIRSLRGYFRGVTIVAAFNGVVVGLGALVLGVPLAGTIAIVTFVTAYVPYIGAFVAGAFAVILALGAKDAKTALVMLIIVLLANGLLQNIVQPFAMGAALDLNPLVVLVLTIGAGCLFGMAGLILAAPLASAAVHITRDLGAARAKAVAAEEPAAAT
jgi:putative heme transporter